MPMTYGTTYLQSSLTNIGEIKRSLLFFDKLNIVGLDSINNPVLRGYAKNYVLGDLEYLLEMNQIEGISIDGIITNADARNACKKGRDLINKHSGEFEKLTVEEITIGEYQTNARELQISGMAWYVRGASILLRSKGHDVTPLVTPKLLIKETTNRTTEKVDAFTVVMNNFPFPTDRVPLHEILQFKEDDETKHKILRLRNWSRKMSSQASANEIIDEANEHLYDYQKYMNACGVENEMGVVESLISIASNMLGGIKNFDLEKILNPCIGIKKARANLMKSECGAPGKELSFIAHAKDFCSR